MLVSVRNMMGSWVARGFFALLVVMFIFWGISNVFTLAGGGGGVASVAGKPIDVTVVGAIYQRLLNQVSQQGQPDASVRQQVAQQALQQAVQDAVLRQAGTQFGVAVPDAAVRDVLDSVPAFQTNGVFDKAKFTQVLQQNNVSPDQFISDVKGQLLSRQLETPMVNGAAVPAAELDPVFALLGQTRAAVTVNVPVSSQPAPAAPDDAVLQRYWRNHQAQFTTPEYRKAQVVILSPALLAPQEQVAPAALQAGLAQAQAQTPSAAVRSADVLSVEDLADASQLQAAWQKGASWEKMQALAKRYHATPVPLSQMQQNQIPSASLAQAIFAAPPGQVVGPVAGEMGMYLFKVTDIGQTGPSPAQLTAQVTQQIQLQMAQADVAKNVDALQDALAGQTPLDQLPGNLGLVAVQGTLDAKGLTPAGQSAPIPGGDDLKNAIVQTVFATQKGAAPSLQNGPDGSYYAVAVQDVLPPAAQPFAQAKPAVLAAWTQDQQQRAAQAEAANLMHAVNSGQNLQVAAQALGLQTAQTPPYARDAQPQDQPSQLVPVLYSLKLNQATMLDNGQGYMVAVLNAINEPDKTQDADAYQRLRQTLDKSVQDDMAQSFLAGLSARDKVTVDQKQFSQIYQ